MATAPIPRNIIDPRIHGPEPISPNLMQNVVTWIRDPQVPLLAKIGMAALFAITTLAAGAIAGQALLSLFLTGAATVIWGIREYSLQSEMELYQLGGEIRHLQQQLAYTKVRNLFENFDGLAEIHNIGIAADGNYQINVEDLHRPGYRGIDRFERPFIVLKIRGRYDLLANERILVLFQRYNTGGEWSSSVLDGENILNPRLGEEDFTQLRNILVGEHPDYELVEEHPDPFGFN